MHLTIVVQTASAKPPQTALAQQAGDQKSSRQYAKKSRQLKAVAPHIRLRSPNLAARHVNRTEIRDRILKSFGVEMAGLDFGDARSLVARREQMLLDPQPNQLHPLNAPYPLSHLPTKYSWV